MNANKIVTVDDRAAIEERIAQIEQRTSAELVCAVATESGRYDRAESVVGLLMGIFCFGLVTWASQYFQHQGDWGDGNAGIVLQLVSLVLGFVIGNYFASYCFPLRRALLSEKEMTSEAERAASYIFCKHSVSETNSRTGILVYLSLFERRLIILADQACREALGAEAVAEICQASAVEMKSKGPREAILLALEQLAPYLEKSLPTSRELNQNELSDHVLVFHRSCC